MLQNSKPKRPGKIVVVFINVCIRIAISLIDVPAHQIPTATVFQGAPFAVILSVDLPNLLLFYIILE
jgi:hypothetical protein